jgi:hypothetical protein
LAIVLHPKRQCSENGMNSEMLHEMACSFYGVLKYAENPIHESKFWGMDITWVRLITESHRACGAWRRESWADSGARSDARPNVSVAPHFEMFVSGRFLAQ